LAAGTYQIFRTHGGIGIQWLVVKFHLVGRDTPGIIVVVGEDTDVEVCGGCANDRPSVDSSTSTAIAGGVRFQRATRSDTAEFCGRCADVPRGPLHSHRK